MWELELLLEGSKSEIYILKKNKEIFELEEFFKKIFPDKKKRKNAQDCFFRLFERTVDNGLIHNRKQFEKLKDNIYEFKCKGIRILCYLSGRKIYLLHGFKKQTQKTPRKEIEKAEAIIKELKKILEA